MGSQLKVKAPESGISQNAIIPSTGNKAEKKKNWRWIWILISVAIPLVCLSLGILWYIKKIKHQREEYERQKRDEYFLELTASESFKDVHQLEGNGGNAKGNDLLLFSLTSIMAALMISQLKTRSGRVDWTCLQGKIKRWTRNCGQKAFKNIRARACGIQE